MENCQAWAKLDLTLGPVTTFVGPTDVGKSTVLRMIRWIATNYPAGDAFIRRGSKGCQAAARIDGTWVARRRGAKENVYQVGNDLPLQLERGGAVPKAVADLLNVGPSNFQGQHDGPFWLTDTPGQAAKNLNGIVDLTRIDAAAEAAAAGVRAAKAALDAADARAARAEVALAAADWVAGCLPGLEKLEAADREIARTRTRRVVLAELVRRVEAASARRAAFAEVAAAGGDAVGAGADTVEVRAKRAALEAAVAAVTGAKAAAGAGVPPVAWDALAAARAAADEAALRRGDLDAALGRVDELGAVLCRLNDAVGQSEAELAEIVRRMGGVCPTCRQPADPSRFVSATPTSDPPRRPPAAKPRTGGVDFKLPTPKR